MRNEKPDRELLAQWVKFGLAIEPTETNGVWTWSEKGASMIPSIVRILMSDKLYGEEIPVYMEMTMLEAHINMNGEPDKSWYK